MKKSLIISLISFMFTAFAPNVYAEDFIDLDKNTSTYQILEDLSKKYNFSFDFPDSKFKGERTITRYEIAKIILDILSSVDNRIDDESDKHILDQLANDFYTEIEAIKPKLDEIENQVDMLETNTEKQGSDLKRLSDLLPFSLNGDLGLRYQMVTKDIGKDIFNGTPQIRTSLSINSKDNNPIGYGVRLVSGGVNRTTLTWWKMADFFGKVPLNFDKFFVKYKPNNNFDFTLGRFSNPFGNSDMYFDDEMTQQGALQVFKCNDLAPFLKELSFTAGEVVVNMDKDFGNTFSLNGLAEAKMNFDDFFTLNVKGGYYHYIGENNIAQANKIAKEKSLEAKLSGNTNTNTLDEAGNFKSQFRIADIFAKGVFKLHENFPLSFSGNYLYNITDSKDNQAFRLSAKIGTLKEVGNFFVGYDYTNLQADATISFFTDNQLAGTDVNAHMASAGVKLFPSTILSTTFLAKNSIKKQDPLTYALRVNLIQFF